MHAFQSWFRNHTFKQRRSPSLTCRMSAHCTKLVFSIGSVKKSCGGGVHQGTYVGPCRFAATSPPRFIPCVVLPRAQPQAGGPRSFYRCKAGSPPWLTPDSGNAIPHGSPREAPHLPAALHPVLRRVSRP